MAFCISFDKLLSFHQFALVIKFPFYGWPWWLVLLRSEIPSSMCAKLCTVAASNNRDHPCSQSLTIACSRYIYNGVILHAHPVRGESHIQHNTTGEVATAAISMQVLKSDCKPFPLIACNGLMSCTMKSSPVLSPATHDTYFLLVKQVSYI